MASAKSVKLDERKFKEAVRLACNLLQVDGLYHGQEEALKQFFRGKNIFFSAHTGYGKSLNFQAIPIISDVLNDQVVGSSVVLVISPLISLMKDQVRNCNERLGISAGAIYSMQDEQVLQSIEDGCYSLVYTSPEALLATKRWRSFVTSSSLRDRCAAVVIDEGHCLVHW